VDINIVYKKVGNFVLFETIVLLLVCSVTFTTSIYTYFTQTPSFLTNYFATFELLVYTSNSVMIIQFVNVVIFLRHICKCISNEVEICCDTIEDRHRYSTVRSYPGGVSVYRWRSVMLADYLWNEIHDLRIAYSRLCTVTCKVNSYYGFPILLSVLWLFMSIVLVLSLTLDSFIYSSNTDSTLERDINFYNCIWYCIYCGILIIIVKMLCHQVGNETDNIMFHVQKLLLKHDLENEIEKQLNQFCCQLNYLKPEFSACGIFTLNLHFLNSFLSMSLAYFVITFQWK
jgi:hypothetical protein